MIKTNYDTIKEQQFHGPIDESKRHQFGVGISKYRCIICGEKRKDVDKFGICVDCNQEFPIKDKNIKLNVNLSKGTKMSSVNNILIQIKNLFSFTEKELNNIYEEISNAAKTKDIIKIQEKTNEANNISRIRDLINNLVIQIEENSSKSLLSKNEEAKKITYSFKNLSNYSFHNKIIKSFEFDEKIIEVDTWQDLLIQLCSILYKKDQKLFQSRIISIGGSKRPYFSYEKNKIQDLPKKINDSNIFVETKFDSSSIVKLCYKILGSMNYPEKSLKINIKE
ncbi:MAG: hypothetical protein WAR79_17540 [Melioribacteraceae bacterium]